VFSCSGFFSCIELCSFLCCLVLLLSVQRFPVKTAYSEMTETVLGGGIAKLNSVTHSELREGMSGRMKRV